MAGNEQEIKFVLCVQVEYLATKLKDKTGHVSSETFILKAFLHSSLYLCSTWDKGCFITILVTSCLNDTKPNLVTFLR